MHGQDGGEVVRPDQNREVPGFTTLGSIGGNAHPSFVRGEIGLNARRRPEQYPIRSIGVHCSITSSTEFCGVG
jgi:hypothetical protein